MKLGTLRDALPLIRAFISVLLLFAPWILMFHFIKWIANNTTADFWFGIFVFIGILSVLFFAWLIGKILGLFN